MADEVVKSNILNQIDDLVSKATFSLDAVEAVNKLKNDLSAFQQRNELLEKRVELLQQELSKKSETIDVLRDDLHDCKNRIKAFEENKVKADKAIYDADKYKAVSETWQQAMNIVFKPPHVRESVMSTKSSNVNGMCNSDSTHSSVMKDFE